MQFNPSSPSSVPHCGFLGCLPANPHGAPLESVLAQTRGWLHEDVAKDGAINVLDIIIIGQHFGQGCPS